MIPFCYCGSDSASHLSSHHLCSGEYCMSRKKFRGVGSLSFIHSDSTISLLLLNLFPCHTSPPFPYLHNISPSKHCSVWWVLVSGLMCFSHKRRIIHDSHWFFTPLSTLPLFPMSVLLSQFLPFSICILKLLLNRFICHLLRPLNQNQISALPSKSSCCM